MRLDPLVLRDYIEVHNQDSNSRLLDLFQRRYAHSLIVSPTRNEKQTKILVVAPFPFKAFLICLLYQLKWLRLELG